MARTKKERPLIERGLDKEDLDYTQLSLQEIKTLIDDLVEMQRNRIRKAEILKLQDIVIKASEMIKEILEKEK